jgi:hypothetical protein
LLDVLGNVVLSDRRIVMAIESVWCSVLREPVTRVTTLEGEVTAVICPEFESAMKTCRLKKAAGLGGPLARLLERASEDTLSDPAPRCSLA